MPDQYAVEPIGWVRCDRAEPIDDQWDSFPATIELDESKFDGAALLGLADFSHAEIIYLFHRVEDAEIETRARHPRGRTDWPRIGVFAQRGKGRPNRLGATVCRVVSVDGAKLRVEGLDAIDGAPVLDIKPVMSGFLPRGDFREPQWARELMQDYW
jgi:tRNA (Thr-GGU) A37 N-methylase